MRRLAMLLMVAALALAGCVIQPALSVALDSPANGGTVSSQTPILAWTSAGGATSYRLQVATDANFSDLVVDKSGMTGPSYSIASGTLETGRSYYWRVNATRGSETTAFSPYWTFKTQGSSDSLMVNATLNGSSWSGAVQYTLTGPKAGSGASVPQSFAALPEGTYGVSYTGGGPPGASLTSITPSPTQVLSTGGAITFTLNFQSQPSDTILVNATLDGSIWSGSVYYTLHGPKGESGASVAQTFSGLPDGTYTLSYSSGGPSGATLSSITPSPTQALSSGGTVAFTLNFHRTHPDSTVYVDATLDGRPWSGRVTYDIHGPRADSSARAPDSFDGMPHGTYTIAYRHGGPTGASLTSITPQPTQTLHSGRSISFTLNFHSQSTGRIYVDATLDGASWAGEVSYVIHGPWSASKDSVPHSYGDLPSGTYTVSYLSGGPPGASLMSISPSPTQTLPEGGTIRFTLNFHAGQSVGTILVNATLDGQPWEVAVGSGKVSYSLRGPKSDSGHSVPETFSNCPAGTYTLSFLSGGPIGATLSSISPGPRQTLAPGGTISYTLNFHAQAKGTVLVNATLDGKPWSGSVSYVLHGPYVDSSEGVPDSFTNCPPGTYTVSYSSGGPHQSQLISITPPRQHLSSGGTISFTLNFKFQGGVIPGVLPPPPPMPPPPTMPPSD